jgi:hypothetical protein
VYSCSEKKIRAGFDLSDRTIPLWVELSLLSDLSEQLHSSFVFVNFGCGFGSVQISETTRHRKCQSKLKWVHVCWLSVLSSLELCFGNYWPSYCSTFVYKMQQLNTVCSRRGILVKQYQALSTQYSDPSWLPWHLDNRNDLWVAGITVSAIRRVYRTSVANANIIFYQNPHGMRTLWRNVWRG